MARPTARSFLLTVHEPDSTVLEDLRTGQRIHVAELAEVGSQVLTWLAVADAEEQAAPVLPPEGIPKVRETRGH